MGQGKASSVSLGAQPRGYLFTHIPLAPPRCNGAWEVYLQLLLCKKIDMNKQTLLQVEIKQR